MKKIDSGNLFLGLGVLLIAAALLLTAYNIIDGARAGRFAQTASAQLKTLIDLAKENSINTKTASGRPLYETHPEMSMPLIEIDGNYYVGVLSLPTLDLELPVAGDFSYDELKNAPCLYEGSAYLDNMIIAGHNYSRHFGNLKNLNLGDRVTFVDGDGNEFFYDVSEILVLSGSDIEGMEQGDWDLTLFTCNISGTDRITVRLKKAQ